MMRRLVPRLMSLLVRRLMCVFPVCVVGAMCVAPTAVRAQQNPTVPRAHASVSRNDVGPRKRAALEQRFRQRSEQIVRRRLGLTDGQMQQLRTVNRGLDLRRRLLVQQERQTHQALRTELARGNAANQNRVARLNAQESSIRQQRFDLQQEERRRLATFLTPVQQAQYAGLQEQLRQRVQQLRGQNHREGDLTPLQP